MSNPKPVAVVIPNYNRINTLRPCIESIRNTAGHPDCKIIVVDGGSTDGSAEWLDAQEDVHVIHLADRGVPNAVNAGIAAAGGRDIVRVHSDVVFETDGWLAAMTEAAATLPAAGVLTGKLVLPDDRIHCVGRSIISGVGVDERHSYRQRFVPDSGAGGDAVEVDSSPGALLYATRECLVATGGFDERYWPMGLDHDDFCMAARHAGFKVYALPSIKAVHFTCGFTPTTERHLRYGVTEVQKVSGLRPGIENLHAEYWQQKWGFHPRHPDLPEIRRLYGDTEICWRIGAPMRFEPGEWPPTVDMVMVTWNNLAVLKRCMESLAETRYPSDRAHMHISDNGSTDGTLEYLRELRDSGSFPFPITIHELAVNTGVAVGFNWAIRAGEGELVARMDDDVVVPPQWLEVLVETFKNRPFAGVVGPKILNDNAIKDIQCGPFRMYPTVYGHENEPDEGQADYVARVTHVRGCLNVYRRDALDDCGLFDLRFSPSQFDDPDHHANLGLAGWEVIYDGRVGVIHAMNSGAGKTEAALTNQAANQSKLFGKWGNHIWKVLEMGIELSREGKYLPDDGDTSRFLATLEDKASYPRIVTGAAAAIDRERALQLADLRERALFEEEPLGEVWDDNLEQARMMRRDGLARFALPVVQAVADLQPWRWRTLHDVALTYLSLGEIQHARRILARARVIAPNEAAIESLSTQIDRARLLISGGGHKTGVSPADGSKAIGEPKLNDDRVAVRSRMKVLMVNTYERRVAGGDMHQVKKTAQYLERLGVDVDIRYEPRPNPAGYDLVHVWNTWFPQQTMAQIKGIHVAAPDTPIVMTPIYWDMSEKNWADSVVPQLFERAANDAQLRGVLKQLAGDVLLGNGRRRSQAGEPNFNGYELYQKETLKYVDYLLPNSTREVENLAGKLGVRLPYTVVHNGAEVDIFDAATPDRFVDRFGVKDFVLTVGLVENRKNQLMLLHALKGTGMQAVVVGRSYDRRYFNLCQKHAADDTIFIEHLPHEELASALKAARVFALPSWMECAAFANVEAALAGCSLVVSDRTSEPEYFGRDAYYCDPANVDSIRDAVMKASRYHGTDAVKRERLRQQFRERFTWENAAQAVLTGYEKAIESRRGGRQAVTAEPAAAMSTI